MKGTDMSPTWQTLQLFLSDDGVHEVEATSDDYRKMRCTCSVYKTGKRCKHIRFIRRHVEDNDGNYSIYIPEHLTEGELDEALESPETFRELLIHYSRIEVIP